LVIKEMQTNNLRQTEKLFLDEAEASRLFGTGKPRYPEMSPLNLIEVRKHRLYNFISLKTGFPKH
jgi:hypothetical protein